MIIVGYLNVDSDSRVVDMDNCFLRTKVTLRRNAHFGVFSGPGPAMNQPPLPGPRSLRINGNCTADDRSVRSRGLRGVTHSIASGDARRGASPIR